MALTACIEDITCNTYKLSFKAKKPIGRPRHAPNSASCLVCIHVQNKDGSVSLMPSNTRIRSDALEMALHINATLFASCIKYAKQDCDGAVSMIVCVYPVGDTAAAAWQYPIILRYLRQF